MVRIILSRITGENVENCDTDKIGFYERTDGNQLEENWNTEMSRKK